MLDGSGVPAAFSINGPVRRMSLREVGANALTALCAVSAPSLVAARTGNFFPADRAASREAGAELPAVTYNRRLTNVAIDGGVMHARTCVANESAAALALLAEGAIYRRAIAALALAPGRPLEIHPQNDPLSESALEAREFDDLTTTVNEYDPIEHRIFWNPHQSVHAYRTGPHGELVCERGSSAATLGHELLHAAEQKRNPARSLARSAILDPVFGSAEERAIALLTTAANAEIGEPPMRNHQCTFVNDSAGGTRPSAEACIPPARTEDELIGVRLGDQSTVTHDFRAAHDALTMLERDSVTPSVKLRKLIADARIIYSRAQRRVAEGGSYGALRTGVDTHLQQALQATTGDRVPLSGKGEVAFYNPA